MPIIDNRILIDDADAVTNFVQVAGGTMDLIADTTRIEGDNSIAIQVSVARDGVLFDAGATQDWSGNVFYIWWNVTTSQLLRPLVNVGSPTVNTSGVTMRFCGATITDWFEIFLAGSDTYSGGWVMSVVDIDVARALAVGSPNFGVAATNGTPPATTAIQYVGIIADVPVMAKGVENLFVDAMWRLPAGEPGIIVSGRNDVVSPIRPWTWDDIVAAGDITDTTKAWGTITKDDGIIKLNTPVQFGNNGSPDDGDHDFEDTLVVGAWESKVVDDGFYGFTIVGDAANTQRLVAGVSGQAGQGWTFVTETPNGPRWFLESTDADIDLAGFYGCRFDHTTVIDIDHLNVDMYDSLLIDGQRLYHSRAASPRSGADFQRNVIINPTPIYGEGSPLAITSPENIAYLWSDDPNKVIDCVFNYNGDHAMRINETGAFDFVGNQFTRGWLSGGSPSGDQTLNAGLVVLQGGLILNVSGGGDTPTVFDFGSPITVINNNISVTITGILPGTEIRVYLSQDFTSPADLTEIAGIESTGSPGEFTFSAAAGLIVDIVVLNVDFVLPPANRIRNFTIPTSDTSFPITQLIDRNKV